MAREEKHDVQFRFLVTRSDREAISALALLLDRNESDTVRSLIREAARARGILPSVGVDQIQVAGSQEQPR